MRQQPETIGDVILLYVQQQYGTQATAAIAFHCSATMLSEVIRGTRRPTERMLTAVGYRHVEVWIPQSTTLPPDAVPLGAPGVAPAECGLCGGRGFYGVPGARCEWCKGTGKSVPAPTAGVKGGGNG